MLDVKDLNIEFHDHLVPETVVHQVSLHMDAGEIVGLVGESGSGKSMTALAIAGLLSRHDMKKTGEILFEGTDLLHCERSFLRELQGNDISVVFQEPMTSLNPVYRIGWQVEEPLRIHHPELSAQERKQRALTLLKQVELEDPERIYQSYPHQISGGQRQRVMIAAAMICEPKLLIADEPTTALDVTIQAQVLKMMRSLRDKFGTSMILITHDFGVVAQMCDKVAVMYDGRIVEYGRAEDIFLGEDHHPYTKGLFRSIPTISTSQERLQPIPGLMPDPTQQYTGCSFQPRCTYCREICGQQKPTYATEGEHQILCHFPHSREQVEGGDFHE